MAKARRSSQERRLAGMGGFEPPRADTKNRCLTAWLHPNNFLDQILKDEIFNFQTTQ